MQVDTANEAESQVIPPSDEAGTLLTSEVVWREVEGASFAVISQVTPSGDPRSSGVPYKSVGRCLYFAVAPDGWKAKHLALSGKVAVTVPVPRGGLLSLIFPIPPATVSFHGTALVHQPNSRQALQLSFPKMM